MVAMFDTLQYYQDLKRAGLDDAAAAAIAHGQLHFAEQQLVGRPHFDSAVQRLEAGMTALRTEVRLLYLYLTLALLVFGTLAHFRVV